MRDATSPVCAAARQIREGDCIEAMAAMEPQSVHAIVTDPPYGLEFMGKAWDSFGRGGTAPELGDEHGSQVRAFQAWSEAWGREALRVLRPGGHALVFGGTRTYHRMAAGLEDAGFEVRDCLMWLYGSGFPKSLDVAKAIDKGDGYWRGRAGEVQSRSVAMAGPHYVRTAKGDPVTADALRWEGWGTALKPAWEPVIVARKPLERTVAGNVLVHGTGALNIDGCRVEMSEEDRAAWVHGNDAWADRDERAGEGRKIASVYGTYGPTPRTDAPAGRWPANVVLDAAAAAILDEQTGPSVSRAGTPRASAPGGGWGMTATGAEYDDEGGASRFFYCAKTSTAERNAGLETLEARATMADVLPDAEWATSKNPYLVGGATLRRNVHPTVKPIELMRWLVRLVTPPGGTVLDPFAGSGTTGCAAALERFEFVGIEREAEYAAIARARIAWWASQTPGLSTEVLLAAAAKRPGSEQATLFDSLDAA